MNSPCLMPIDVQIGFDFPPWGRRNNPDMEANGRKLLATFRQSGLPIIHVRHDSVEPGSPLRPAHAGNAFRPGFSPLPDEQLISKSVNSAFIGTDLCQRLARIGTRTLILFGVSTDMCVSTTARMAANYGFEVIVVSDACFCFDLPLRGGGTIPAEAVAEAHLATLAFEFCRVMTADEVLEEISRRGS